MSLRGMLAYSTFMIESMLPTKKDWQVKIDKVVDEYWNKTIHLPRKKKKKRRKELNAEYSFLRSMQEYDPIKAFK